MYMFSVCNPCCGTTTLLLLCSSSTGYQTPIVGATIHGTSAGDSYVIDGVTDSQGKLLISRAFSNPATYVFTVTHPTLGTFPSVTLTLNNSGTVTRSIVESESDKAICCGACALQKDMSPVLSLTMEPVPDTDDSMCICSRHVVQGPNPVGANTYWDVNFPAWAAGGAANIPPPIVGVYGATFLTVTLDWSADPCPFDETFELALSYDPTNKNYSADYTVWYEITSTLTTVVDGFFYDNGGGKTPAQVTTVQTSKLKKSVKCVLFCYSTNITASVGVKDESTVDFEILNSAGEIVPVHQEYNPEYLIGGGGPPETCSPFSMLIVTTDDIWSPARMSTVDNPQNCQIVVSGIIENGGE